MKRTEILIRQDRIVYTLLLVTAAVGLAWVLWRHQYVLNHHNSPTVAAPAATAPR